MRGRHAYGRRVVLPLHEESRSRFEEGESCKICWSRELGARRFDGVALNREQKRVLRSSPRGHPIASMVMHSDVMKERLNSMQALYERRTKWRSREGGPYYKSSSLQD